MDEVTADTYSTWGDAELLTEDDRLLALDRGFDRSPHAMYGSRMHRAMLAEITRALRAIEIALVARGYTWHWDYKDRTYTWVPPDPAR